MDTTNSLLTGTLDDPVCAAFDAAYPFRHAETQAELVGMLLEAAVTVACSKSALFAAYDPWSGRLGVVAARGMNLQPTAAPFAMPKLGRSQRSRLCFVEELAPNAEQSRWRDLDRASLMLVVACCSAGRVVGVVEVALRARFLPGEVAAVEYLAERFAPLYAALA